MRKMILFGVSFFFLANIASHLQNADQFAINFEQTSNYAEFLRCFIELIKVLVVSSILGIIWLADGIYVIESVGGKFAEQTHVLGQDSEGTSS